LSRPAEGILGKLVKKGKIAKKRRIGAVWEMARQRESGGNLTLVVWLSGLFALALRILRHSTDKISKNQSKPLQKLLWLAIIFLL